jgi:anti-anti-sigma factor
MTVDLTNTSTESADRQWPFDVTVEASTNAHAVIRVSGNADMVTSPQLLAVINIAIANYDDVVLDLSRVNFFSSAAVDVVFDAYARRPSNFRVYAPVRPARQVLELFADDRLLTEAPGPLTESQQQGVLRDAS